MVGLADGPETYGRPLNDCATVVAAAHDPPVLVVRFSVLEGGVGWLNCTYSQGPTRKGLPVTVPAGLGQLLNAENCAVVSNLQRPKQSTPVTVCPASLGLLCHTWKKNPSLQISVAQFTPLSPDAQIFFFSSRRRHT